MVDDEVVRPGALRRGSALVIDLIVISAGALLLSVLLPRGVVLSSGDVPALSTSSAAWWLQTVVVVAWSGAYVVLCWTRLGATAGDALLRLRRRDVDGDPVHLRHALAAWALVFAPPSVATIVGGVAPLAGAAAWLLVAAWYLTLGLSFRVGRAPGALHDRWTGVVTLPRAPAAANPRLAGRPPRPATN